jgi:hypothetical protein
VGREFEDAEVDAEVTVQLMDAEAGARTCR